MTDDNAFLNLEEGAYARLRGVHDEVSDWHVNNHFMLSTDDRLDVESLLLRVSQGGEAGEGVEHGYILQRADASKEWLVLTVYETEAGASLDEAHVAVRPNGDLKTTEVEEDINVLAIAATQAALGGG